MKKLTRVLLVFAFHFCIGINYSFSQFYTTPGPNIFGQTDNSQKIEAIGIGDYTNASAQPNAALDITIPYLYVNTPPLIYPGEAKIK